MSELDYVQLNERAAAGDFESVSLALGVNIDASTWAVFDVWRRAAFERSFRPAKMFAVIRGALLEESSVVYERLVHDTRRTTHLLAMRVGDLVTFGVATTWDTKMVTEAWPSLAGWKSKLENNVALVTAWANARAEGDLPDRVHLKVRDDFRVARGGDDEQKFLDAIARAPDDDDLRLAFADWLDERGDARGEFIRLQLAKQTKSTSKRVNEILKTSWHNFAGELAPWVDERCFSRGLVTRVIMTPAAFEKEGERVFSRHPVETLQVKAPKFTEKQLEQVANAPAISRVRRLSIAQHDAEAPRLPLAALANGTHFDSLRALHLVACGFSGEDWSTLFTRIDAPLLEEVELVVHHTHPALWLTLATSSGLKNLKSLDGSVHHALPGGDVGDFAKAMRAMAEQRPKLEKLSFTAARLVNDESIAPLFSKSSVVRLRELHLHGVQLTDETLRSWRRDMPFDELTSLTLRDVPFSAEELARFLEALPPRLEQLSLQASSVKVYEALLNVPISSSLKRVTVRDSERAQHHVLRQQLKKRFEVVE